MKHNRVNVRHGRRTRTQRGKSRYAAKRDGGQQMYGPGCCAHGINEGQIAAARRRARDFASGMIPAFDPMWQRHHE